MCGLNGLGNANTMYLITKYSGIKYWYIQLQELWVAKTNWGLSITNYFPAESNCRHYLTGMTILGCICMKSNYSIHWPAMIFRMTLYVAWQKNRISPKTQDPVQETIKHKITDLKKEIKPKRYHIKVDWIEEKP